MTERDLCIAVEGNQCPGRSNNSCPLATFAEYVETLDHLVQVNNGKAHTFQTVNGALEVDDVTLTNDGRLGAQTTCRREGCGRSGYIVEPEEYSIKPVEITNI